MSSGSFLLALLLAPQHRGRTALLDFWPRFGTETLAIPLWRQRHLQSQQMEQLARLPTSSDTTVCDGCSHDVGQSVSLQPSILAHHTSKTSRQRNCKGYCRLNIGPVRHDHLKAFLELVSESSLERPHPSTDLGLNLAKHKTVRHCTKVETS